VNSTARLNTDRVIKIGAGCLTLTGGLLESSTVLALEMSSLVALGGLAATCPRRQEITHLGGKFPCDVCTGARGLP
jgi:hypothetical protein